MATQIQLRRGTAAQWTAANPILAEGEMGVELDTSNFKIGNGTDNWNDLSYGFLALPAGGTTGQILSKDSNADYDFAWIDNYTELLGITIRNNTGSTLTKGQLVYINGATGGKVTVALADASTEPTSAKTIGMVQSNIANNANGLVVTSGSITGLNTDGLTAGAPLWLSTTPGEFTETEPISPDHRVLVGYVENVHPTQGAIFVKTATWPEIEELTGVLISTPADNEVLTYEESTGQWKNKVIPAQTLSVLGDVDLTGLDDNYILRYDAATSEWKAEVLPTGVQDLDDLTDVDLTVAPTAGQVLTYNGSTNVWEAADLPTDVVGATTLEELNDVNVVTEDLTDGQYLRWQEATNEWIADDLQIPSLDDLQDVDLTTPPNTNDVLTYDGTNWIAGGVTNYLYNLGDVDLTTTSPADGDVLAYDATADKWVPVEQSGGTGGGYPSIQTVTYTTASIADGVHEKSTVDIEQGYRLLKIETDVVARVRLYTTTTGRDADETRVFGVDPDPNNGVMFDYKTALGDLSNDLNPVDGFVASGTLIPITVTNHSGATDTVTVTLTYVRTI